MGNLFGKHIFIALAALTAGFCSCVKQGPDNTPYDPLKVSRTSITVGNDAAQATVSVTSFDGNWTLTGITDWCTADPRTGETGSSVSVTIDIAEYVIDGDDVEEVGRRETILRITSSGTEREITVVQLPHKITTPDQNADYFINETIHRDILSKWYLWNSEVESTRADYNQSYDKFVQNYLLSLKQNINIDGGTWSRTNTRYLYSYIERRPKGIAHLPRLSYGMEFDLKTLRSGTGDRMVGRILYVLQGSPAAAAGLKRGDWFSRVNGRRIEEWNYTQRIDTLVKPLAGETVTLGIAKRNYAGYLEETSATATLTPTYYRGNPILHRRVIDYQNVAGTTVPVGYLVYSAFDPAFEQELISAFSELKKDNAETLILDLRYNRGGSVETAELMANLIAPQSLAGRTFATYTFNNGTARTVFEPHSSGIAVSRLIVIATEFTAGAAELLINAFNGMEDMEFVLIGSRTEGMNVGTVALEDAVDNNEYVYNIYPVAFSCANDAGTGNYKHGFSPNGQQISEWDDTNIVWDTNFGVHVGKSADALLVAALQYAVGNVDLPPRPATIQTSGAREGYPRLFSFPAAMTMERNNTPLH